MSKISKSINPKQLKSAIVSLFRSSSSLKLPSTINSSIQKPNLSAPHKALTSKQSLLSTWFPRIRVTHGGGARPASSSHLTESEVNYQAPSSSSEVNGTTQTTKRKNLCTLRTSVPVRAYCLSHRIDLMGLMSENQANLILHTSGIGNYIILKFGDLADSPTPPLPPQDSYMVVFPYGSTVMFNMLDHEVGAYLEIIKRHASGMLPEKTKDHGDSTQKYIDCEVREKLYLPTSVQGGLNHMMFQNLSIDGISAIASVLGQSVALDYYSRLVDRRISEYTNINAGLEESGTLCSSKKFLKLVQRTYVDAGIVYGFGISARSDVTWKEDTECSHIFDYLRDKLKLTQRFADLDRKLKMRELHVWFAIVEIGLPKATANLSAYIIGSAVILCLPVLALPVNALDTYLMSI